MMRVMQKEIWLRILPFLFAAPRFVYGEVGGTPQDIGGLTKILCNVMNWLFVFALIVGVVAILIAAFTYISSGGNSEKVDTANKMMLYAVVGLVVALIARSVPIVVGDLLGGSIKDACSYP